VLGVSEFKHYPINHSKLFAHGRTLTQNANYSNLNNGSDSIQASYLGQPLNILKPPYTEVFDSNIKL